MIHMTLQIIKTKTHVITPKVKRECKESCCDRTEQRKKETNNETKKKETNKQRNKQTANKQ